MHLSVINAQTTITDNWTLSAINGYRPLQPLSLKAHNSQAVTTSTINTSSTKEETHRTLGNLHSLRTTISLRFSIRFSCYFTRYCISFSFYVRPKSVINRILPLIGDHSATSTLNKSTAGFFLGLRFFSYVIKFLPYLSLFIVAQFIDCISSLVG